MSENRGLSPISEDDRRKMRLGVSSVFWELFSPKVLFITLPISIFLVIMSFAYRAYQQERLPFPYFQGKPEKIVGVAGLYQLPRGRLLVNVIKNNGDAIYLDCLPIQSVCDRFSAGERIGRVELTAFHIGRAAYWPDSLSIDGSLVLSSDTSLVAYEKYRNKEIAFYFVLIKIAFFLGAYSIGIYLKKRVSQSNS